MSREVYKLLNDILKSICIIEDHLQDVPSLSTYQNNIMIVDAVERRLAIIGEAMWKADKMDDSLIISDKQRIISLRHILVHDYDLIEDASIWLICKRNLPVLKEEVQSILNIK